jgi:hypothetical protein
MTFTTVGYGDIVPLSAQGKLLAICTALLGFTHGVTFVALVLQALTQHPSGKNQERLNDAGVSWHPDQDAVPATLR